MTTELFSIILIGIAVLLYLILVFVRFRIKHEYKVNPSKISFLADSLQRSDVQGHQKYDVYSPTGDTVGVIDQYVIRQLKGKKVLMCKYKMPLQNIIFQVYLFDESKQLLDNYLIKQSGAFRHSQIIDLPNECAYVNLEIEKFVDLKNDFKVVKYQKQVVAVKLQSIILLLMLFPVTYASFLIRGSQEEFEPFVQDINVGIVALLMVLCSLVYYHVNVSKVRKKLYTTGGRI